MSTGPSWVAARLAPSAGLWWCSIAMSDAIRDEDDGQQAPRKQAKSAEKSDIGEEPAGSRPPAHTRRPLYRLVKSTATQTVSAALAAGASRKTPKASDIEEHHAAVGGSGFTTDRIAEGVNWRCQRC